MHRYSNERTVKLLLDWSRTTKQVWIVTVALIHHKSLHTPGKKRNLQSNCLLRH